MPSTRKVFCTAMGCAVLLGSTIAAGEPAPATAEGVPVFLDEPAADAGLRSTLTFESRVMLVDRATLAEALDGGLPDSLRPVSVPDSQALIDATLADVDGVTLTQPRLRQFDRDEVMALTQHQTATVDSVRSTDAEELLVAVASSGISIRLLPSVMDDGQRVALSAEVLTEWGEEPASLTPAFADGWTVGWTGGRFHAVVENGKTYAVLLPLSAEQVAARNELSVEAAATRAMVLLLGVSVDPPAAGG